MKIDSLNDIWGAVCEICKQNITEIAFNVWINDLHPIDMKDNTLVLGIYSAYKKSVIEATYMPMLKENLKAIMGVDMQIKIIVEDENGQEKKTPVITSQEDSYTFDNFIVGSTNRYAHAAAMAIATNPEDTMHYNPLVIYGPSGVGKTHLMFAIKNEVLRRHPEYKVVYVRSEEFTRQLIKALQDGKIGLGTMEDFHNRYRNVDMLLIDDIQFIAGKESTQEEFFNTFNSLYENKKHIVVTLDRPVKTIATLEDRIKTRLQGGMPADITPADFETRVGIIIKKAELLGITLPDDVVYEIAKKIISNVRQLEGVVTKLHAYIKLDNKIPTISTLNNIIRDVIDDTQPEPIKIERIIEEVARCYQVSESDILSNRRPANIALARQIAMYIAKETTELSYQAIGETFGRDHSTVIYNVEKAEKHITDKPYEKEIIDEIIRNLKSE